MAALPARIGRVKIDSTRSTDKGTPTHAPPARALRDGLRRHGRPHDDHSPAPVLRHRAGGKRHGRRPPRLRLLRRPARRRPDLGPGLRPLRPPAGDPRRPAAHRRRLHHLRLRRVGVAAASLTPGAGSGRRHHRRGAGLRGRRLAPRGADQEPRLALGRDQPRRRGRAGVRFRDDQHRRQAGTRHRRRGACLPGRDVCRALPGRVARGPGDRRPCRRRHHQHAPGDRAGAVSLARAGLAAHLDLHRRDRRLLRHHPDGAAPADAAPGHHRAQHRVLRDVPGRHGRRGRSLLLGRAVALLGEARLSRLGLVLLATGLACTASPRTPGCCSSASP